MIKVGMAQRQPPRSLPFTEEVRRELMETGLRTTPISAILMLERPREDGKHLRAARTMLMSVVRDLDTLIGDKPEEPPASE